jgi:hypothetical protein
VRVKLEKEPAAEVEKWLVGSLTHLQKEGKHAGKTKKSDRIVLHRIRFNERECEAVNGSFMLIAESYLSRGDSETANALRMMRMASVYRKLSQQHLKTAIEIACRLSSPPGYWVGAAAYDLVLAKKNIRYSETILKMSAASGNELSKFILDCFNLSGGSDGVN